MSVYVADHIDRMGVKKGGGNRVNAQLQHVLIHGQLTLCCCLAVPPTAVKGPIDFLEHSKTVSIHKRTLKSVLGHLIMPPLFYE